ncbi:hypothetical protein BU14_0068s0006 [Porphyra umbilicalis]|uniref:Uncharacterized protein n=1 Tax=Porphyra umbilicalis TaxID=2786 RepID=A0A1X6PGD6_PORUM|nr:hypothetical protein BU14_0068s0006 [Porphyra umbilicalis]|eukprot:OSX79910.1 hypothetical protein BU14_0068s0006 [Porphyra umbilicalis]
MQVKGGWPACRLSHTQPHRVAQVGSDRICLAFPAQPTRLLYCHPPCCFRRLSLRDPRVRPKRPVPPAAMAFHRAAVWLIAAAAAIAVVASVPAARAVPAAATGGNIDANSMTVRAGAFARAALSFPVTDGDGGGAHLTAAQVPAAARVGDLAGDGRFGATLHGVVHWSATLTAAVSVDGTRLKGATEAIAKLNATSLLQWNFDVVTGLGGAKVDGLPLGDRYHIVVIKESIYKAADSNFFGIVYATTWNVNGTSMVLYVFRSGVLRHRARPVFEDLGIYGNGRVKADRSKAPLVVHTFAAP